MTTMSSEIVPHDEDAGRTDDTMDIPKPTPSEYGDERGVQQQLPFSVAYDDKRWEEFRNEDESSPTVRQLVLMRRTDGQARALYRLLTLPIRSALRTATFVPAEEGDKEAEFIDQMFNLPAAGGGMQTPFNRIMAQMLMCVFDGFSAFEQVYWSPSTGPLKGKITLKKLAYRSSETITFLTDEHGEFAGLRQRANLHGRYIDIAVDKEDSFYVAAQEEERMHYGVSFFQSAFHHYDKKVKLYYIAHLAAQRSAVGMRDGTWPVGATEKEKNNFKRALADVGVAQFIAHPENFKVNLLTEQGSFDFLSYINHHNSQMSKSVLAAFFDTNQGGGSSDTSLVNFGEQSDAMFILMLQTIMDEMASAINDWLIPKFVDWNFGTDKYPTFTWGTFTNEQKEAIQKTFDKLAATSPQGVNVTPEFLRQLEIKISDELGLEIDYDEIQKVEDEQKAAEEAANASVDSGFQGAPEGLPAEGAAPTDQPPVDDGAARLEAPVSGQTAALSAPGLFTLDETARHLLLQAVAAQVDAELEADDTDADE